jgi:hypothetical protein
LHELAFDDDLELWKGRGAFKKHIKPKTDRTSLVGWKLVVLSTDIVIIFFF